MSEPAGIIIEAPISLKKLGAFVRTRISREAGEVRVGHVLSELLDQGNRSGDVTILNYDSSTERLFLAWILNHYSDEALSPIWPILEALATQMEPAASAEGVIITTLSDCLASVRIEKGVVLRRSAQAAPRSTAEKLADRLWSFARQDAFPDAATSMRRRDYHCKPFKAAWKSYLTWRDEQERPARIAAATAQDPFWLHHGVVCWDGHVVERNSYGRRDIAFPGADPLSFRLEAGYYADRNHVWQRHLAEGSPPSRIRRGGTSVNNPDAIWEYRIIPGAVGSDFTWIGSRWDTMFWTDKRRIYAQGEDQKLTPLLDVDASRFREYGDCFGKDGQAVFYAAKKLPLDAERLRTEGYFIWDDDLVFMTDRRIPLSGRGFRILGCKQVPAGPGRQYRLADQDKALVVGSSADILPDDPDF